jgi:hypothetical protein
MKLFLKPRVEAKLHTTSRVSSNSTLLLERPTSRALPIISTGREFLQSIAFPILGAPRTFWDHAPSGARDLGHRAFVRSAVLLQYTINWVHVAYMLQMYSSKSSSCPAEYPQPKLSAYRGKHL